MSRLSIGYDIGRFTGACASSGEPLPPGTPCVAALCEAPDQPGFVRRDFSIAAWQSGQRPPGLFSFWRTVAPSPDAPRKLLIDDQSLLDIFLRLEQDQRPERQAFRFVLALILLRRRMLRSVGREQVRVADPSPGGTDVSREVWLLQPRGAIEGAPPLRVVDPRLTEADLATIAEQLGEVVEAGGA